MDFIRTTCKNLIQSLISGECTARDIVSVFCERIKNHNPRLNALLWFDEESAMARAEEIDRKRSKGETMGALAGIAAMLQVAFLQSADPSIGAGLELMVIASAIIGGTALSGGAGTIIGAMIGSLLIAVIRNGIVQLGVSAYWSATVTGSVIIAAVAIDYLLKRKKLS